MLNFFSCVVFIIQSITSVLNSAVISRCVLKSTTASDDETPVAISSTAASVCPSLAAAPPLFPEACTSCQASALVLARDYDMVAFMIGRGVDHQCCSVTQPFSSFESSSSSVDQRIINNEQQLFASLCWKQ
jgi:hypothetical protein